ncbi:MAG: type I restriction enzyme HsdR N-terminal domain-containing protein [Bernardetiaceae bacterium]
MQQDHALIKRGLRGGFIRFEESSERRQVYYPFAKQRFTLTPEEEVRVVVYLRLVLEYNYPPDHISFEHKVKMGSSYKYVDMVFYRQKSTQSVQLIVECKRRDVSPRAFEEAIEQAKSYDMQLLSADYLWITSGVRDTYLRATHARRGRNYQAIPDIPRFSLAGRSGQWLRERFFGLRQSSGEWLTALRGVSLGKTGVFMLLLLVLGFFMSWGMAKLIVPVLAPRLSILFTAFDYRHLFWAMMGLNTWLFLVLVRPYALPDFFSVVPTGSKRRKPVRLSRRQRFLRMSFATAVLATPTLLLAEVFLGNADFCRTCCAHLWDCWWSEGHYGTFDPSWRLMEFFVPFSAGVPFQLLALLVLGKARATLRK